MEEIRNKWTPGNECLWDEYDIESLIDSDEKKSQTREFHVHPDG
jgi:hypothetical protein